MQSAITLSNNIYGQQNASEVLQGLEVLELRKKMVGMLAMQGLQTCLKEMITYSLYQESIKSRLTQEIQKPHETHSDHETSSVEDNQKLKYTRTYSRSKTALYKLIEESYERNNRSDGSGLNDESSDDGRTSLLERRMRQTLMLQQTESITKRISKKKNDDLYKFVPRKKNMKMAKQDTAIIKPWKCSHDEHFADGLCRSCYALVNSKKSTRKGSWLYENLKLKMEAMMNKKQNMEIENQQATSSTSGVKIEATD